jgi:hypothetical protein
MRRALLPLLLIGAPLCAQEPVVPLPAHLVRVVEAPQSPKDKPRQCPDVAERCTVDMKSTLIITPDLSKLPNRRPAARTDPKLVDQRRHLNDALGALEQSLALSKTLMMPNAAARPDAEETSREFNKLRRQMLTSIGEFVKLDPERWGTPPPGQPAHFASGLRGKFDTPENFGTFLGQLRRELDEAEATAVAVSAYQVRVAASRLRGNAPRVPLHIENYDTFDEGKPSFIPHVGFTVSDEERQQTERDFAATDALATAIRTRFRDLVQSANQQADAIRARLETLEGSLRKLLDTALTDLPTSADTLADQLQQAANAAAQPLQGQLLKVSGDVRRTGAALRDVRASVDALRQQAATARSSLTGVTTGADPNHPEKVLFDILDLADTSSAGLTSGVTSLRAKVTALQSALAALDADLAAVDAQAPAKQLVTQFRSGIATAVMDNITASFAQVDVIAKLIDALRPSKPEQDSIRQAGAFLGVNAPQVRTIAEKDIVPGRLRVDNENIAEGDLIEITSEVLEGSNAVYTDRRTVTPFWYGFHQGLSTGLTFVTATRTELSHFAPEAAAVFRFKYRPRPESRSAFLDVRPAVGIHTMTLHFKDNSNPQFGLGVSLHLFDDFLQAGYGMNVRADKDRMYWYFGVGVIQQLRKVLTNQ